MFRNRSFIDVVLYGTLAIVLGFCALALCLAAKAHADTGAIIQPDDPGQLVKLWEGGQILMAIIGGLYLALFYAQGKVPWLSIGRRAVYLAAAVGGLAVIVEAGQRGTTPSLGLLITAVMSAAMIIAKSPSPPPVTTPVTTPEPTKDAT
jgi:hypothetical protein